MKFNIPSYLANIANDAELNSAELAGILGYKNQKGLLSALDRGDIPSPDRVSPYANSAGIHYKKYYWYASTVRKFINGRTKL